MHLEHLDSFLAVVEYRNFSQAARSLGISQSSLSKRIKALEDALGFRLFDRTTKDVRLTDVGSLYLSYADRIADLQEEFAMQLARRFPNDEGLVFGTLPSSADYGLTDLISGFMKETGYPCLLFTARSEDLEVMLAEGRCDFAFIKNNDGAYDFRCVPIIDDHLVFVMPRTHPLADRNSVEVRELRDERLFLEPKGSRPYNECVALCEAAGFSPNIVGTDSQITNIVDYVGLGMGTALLMSRIVPDSPSIATVPISPSVTANITLCARQGRTTVMQREFLDYLESQRHSILHDGR